MNALLRPACLALLALAPVQSFCSIPPGGPARALEIAAEAQRRDAVPPGLTDRVGRLSGPDAAARADRLLAPFCLAEIEINPEARVKAAPGAARPVLEQEGWRTFLIRVRNMAGVTAPLRIIGPDAARNGGRNGWLRWDLRDLESARRTESGEPPAARLDGRPVQFLFLRLHSRDRGRREARLTFDVGQGTQDLGFRSNLDLLFTCLPTYLVTLLDAQGRPFQEWFPVLYDSHRRVRLPLAPEGPGRAAFRVPPGVYHIRWESEMAGFTPWEKRVIVSARPLTVTLTPPLPRR